MALAGCADSPRQYDWSAPVKVEWGEKVVPTSDPIRLPEIPSEKSDDEKARENSKKPILYAVGAAGITFRTPLEEARSLLSKPFYGPDASQGLAAYNEGVYVWWKAEAPRFPDLILITNGYQGTLDAGALGQIGLGRDLSSFFTESDPVAKALLTRLYNHFEKIEDPAFDCVKERICEITPGENDIVLSWPRLGLLVSRDRKVLYRMLLSNGVPQGKLDTGLDLLSARFEGAETPAEMGMAWGTVLERLGLNPESRVGLNWFAKDFSGVFLQLTKSRFDASYLEPEPQEKINAVTVYNGFKQKLLLGGDTLALVTEGDMKKVARLPKGTPLPEGARALELKMELRGQDQAVVAGGLLAAALAALKEKAPGAITAAQVRGGFDDQLDASLDGWVAVMPPVVDGVAADGKMVSLSLRRDSGNLSYVEVAALDEPVDRFLLPQLLKAAAVSKRELAGFRIGSPLMLSAIDRGRSEATLEIATEQGAIATRVSYAENVALEGVFASGQVEVQAVDALRLPRFGVTLGVVRVGPVEGGRVPVAVVSVSSGGAVGGLTGLCGIEGLGAKVGENDRAFKKRLDEAIAKEREKRPSFRCRYVFEEDPNGSGKIEAIYLPTEQVRLGFARNELSSLLLYSNVREVLP